MKERMVKKKGKRERKQQQHSPQDTQVREGGASGERSQSDSGGGPR